ncbi:MAG: ABC transporter substrate-binding protein [Proteobacteria bacterium]|nr:ABC transporter substrate-binding protein [Pseudomonadota bacterium]
MPQALDPKKITSASHYIILLHLVRPLIKMNAQAEVEGDLAESWSNSDNFTVYILKLRADAKWSNGSLITANQVVQTFSHQMNAKSAIHADFSDIRTITAADDHTLHFTLNRPNANFLVKIAHPECGILKNPKATVDIEMFAVTSGPYVLVQKGESSYFLKRNPFYSGFAQDAPIEVLFQSSPLKEQISAIKSKEADFVMPRGGLALDDHHKIIEHKYIKPWEPHLGFSYWMSLNPNSKALSDHATRKWIQCLLAPGKVDDSSMKPFWEPASQMYLPEGIGRLTKWETSDFWTATAASVRPAHVPHRLHVLVSKGYPFSHKVLEALQGAGIKLDISEYSKQDEFVALSKAKRFDIFMIDNDFSSVDLIENLLVTFNETRPLVTVKSGSDWYRSRLHKAENSMDPGDRHLLFREIAKALLDDALIAPLSYFHVVGYRNENLDISSWSTLFPEVAFWKASIKRH